MSHEAKRACSLIPCPCCDGDGFFIYVGGPGYFSHSFGNYLPTERVITCERCAGAGEVEFNEKKAGGGGRND